MRFDRPLLIDLETGVLQMKDMMILLNWLILVYNRGASFLVVHVVVLTPWRTFVL